MAEERDRESPWWNGVFRAGRPARTEPSAIASPLLDAIPMTLRGGTRFTCVGEQPWALLCTADVASREQSGDRSAAHLLRRPYRRTGSPRPVGAAPSRAHAGRRPRSLQRACAREHRGACCGPAETDTTTAQL